MKKTVLAVIILLCSGLGVSAQETQATAVATNRTQAVVPPATNPLEQGLARVQTEWARIKYQLPEKSEQRKAIQQLGTQAAELSAAYPDQAEPKIWQGIIVATDAGIGKWFSALGKVKQAKALFEAAIEIDPQALDGAAYTSLGSLYYQVPGWPVGFGDTDKAQDFLQKGLAIDPDGIEANYFYGDFLLQEKQYKEARLYLNKALQAPDRPERPIADAGRREEIKTALAQIEKKLK